MKKTFYSAMLTSVLLMAVSCSKSFEAEEGQSGVQEAAPLFTASTENDESKTTLGTDDFVHWETTDFISVNGSKYKVKEITEGNPTRAKFEIVQGEKTPKSPYQAFYPYELYDGTTATQPKLPEVQTYQTGELNVNPMYAESTTQSFTFKNICALLEIVVPEGKTVTKVIVSSGQRMNGSFTINADGTTIDFIEDATATNQVILYCGTGADAGSILYVAIPPQTYTNLQIELVGAKLIKRLAKCTVKRNKIYSVEGFKEDDTYGPFSVSASKQVYFSKGNLQAEVDEDGKPTSWNFAANQWDYIGKAGANESIGSNAGTIDLFGWSTDGGETPLANYKQWGINTSIDDKDYVGNFQDWGRNLDLNSSLGFGWSTLTRGEWKYLLSERTVNGGTGEGYSCKRATIKTEGGVYGLIIYPDGYTKQEGKTSYTLSEWSTMEAAGCVFLPAAGWRERTSVTYAGYYGMYWSSTSDDSNAGNAYRMYFINGYVYPEDSSGRHYGRSVRLVRE